MDERDIVDKLQDACTLAMSARDMEKLCGNARTEILNLRNLYNAQCACTDEWAEKYEAEVARKADATLTGRIAELENQLATVNKRLGDALALTP